MRPGHQDPWRIEHCTGAMPSHLLRTSQRKVRIAASMTSAAKTMVIPLVSLLDRV